MTTTASPAVVVMNPRSGGGKVARFRLVERVEAAGARVRLTGPDQDPGALAAAAVADGASVLGVAGGDGTVSAVAAVAAEARLPLVVIPAGTRNHFARDLGLNIRNPGEGAITWTAARITLHGTAARLPAGIDGEAVLLDLPIGCEIRHGALQVLLPTTDERRRPAKAGTPTTEGGRQRATAGTPTT